MAERKNGKISSSKQKKMSTGTKSTRQNKQIKQIRQTRQALMWLVACVMIIGMVIGVARKLTEPDPAPMAQSSTLQENATLEDTQSSTGQEDLADGDAVEGGNSELADSRTEPNAEEVEQSEDEAEIIYLTPEEVAEAGKGVDLQDIPPYEGEPFVVINDNVPYFEAGEMSTTAYEYYSPLDELGRCGVCVASVGMDVMPTEERGSIGSVKPTGWVNNKYPGIVDGSYIYNRCHLIGFQLTGENANRQNLITGTRYINVDGMLPFENMVADYVKETGNHVMYRITPVFDGDNLLASGVLMEAKSVEDDGEGILFNVYCYNVQPGIMIEYSTGDNRPEE